MYEEGIDPVTPIKKEVFTFPAADPDDLGLDPALENVVDIQELLNIAVPALEAGEGPINLDKIFPANDLDRLENSTNYYSFDNQSVNIPTCMTNADEVDSNSSRVEGWKTLTIKTEDLDLTSHQPCRQPQVVTVLPSPCYSSSSSRTSTPEPIVYTRRTPGRKPSAGGPVRPRKRQPTKDSPEYYEKRARNNVAVRKSRDKAKIKQSETETRVQQLCDDNDHLQKKVDLLTKELNVLKSLFINVGASLPSDFDEILNR